MTEWRRVPVSFVFVVNIHSGSQGTLQVPQVGWASVRPHQGPLVLDHMLCSILQVVSLAPSLGSARRVWGLLGGLGEGQEFTGLGRGVHK